MSGWCNILPTYQGIYNQMPSSYECVYFGASNKAVYIYLKQNLNLNEIQEFLKKNNVIIQYPIQ